MGIKILILQACLIAGESIGTPVAVGETVEVSKDDASYLAKSGRGLYVDKTDDPSKGLMTATPEDKKRAAEQGKAIAAAAEASRAASAPPNLPELLANAVAQGFALAMQQQAAAQKAAA